MQADVTSPFFHVECNRGEFPDSTTTVDDVEFARVLREIDPDLEILHVPTRPGIWSVYRVKLRGASPSGDFLIHEMDLPGSPNSGWIEHIRSRQLIRIGETPQDVASAKRFWMDQLKARVRKSRQDKQDRWDNVMHHVRGLMDTYITRRRTSDGFARRKPKRNPVVFRPGVFRIRPGGPAPSTNGSSIVLP